jgi:hypothetical protein
MGMSGGMSGVTSSFPLKLKLNELPRRPEQQRRYRYKSLLAIHTQSHPGLNPAPRGSSGGDSYKSSNKSRSKLPEAEPSDDDEDLRPRAHRR